MQYYNLVQQEYKSDRTVSIQTENLILNNLKTISFEELELIMNYYDINEINFESSSFEGTDGQVLDCDDRSRVYDNIYCYLIQNKKDNF